MTAYFLPPMFPKVLIIDKRDDGRPVVQLVEPFGFHSEVVWRDIVVPAGFVSDLESVPIAVLGLSGRQSPRSGLIHDWLTQAHKIALSDPVEIDRATANAVYRECEIADGVDATHAQLRYIAVDRWGQSSWDSGLARRQILAMT